MSASLAKVLHGHRVDALISEAQLIRDWPESPERIEEATMLIREAMLRCTTGHISHAEESRVFSILSFAMPANYYVEGEPSPQ